MGDRARGAVCAGLLAAAAGLLGKLGMSSDLSRRICVFLANGDHDDVCLPQDGYLNVVSALRALFLLAMVALNSAMIPVFVSALGGPGPSVEVVAVNSGVNFVASGVLGAVLLAEPVSLRWVAGLGLILLGLVFVAGPGAEKTTTTTTTSADEKSQKTD